MLVMPAIHSFEHHRWGWHKMSDLVIAVNNLFKQQGIKSRLKPMELAERFLALTHDGKHLCGIAWTYRGKRKWLRDCVCLHDFSFPGAFVPTGWGITVIDVVKRGAVEIELVVNGNTCERWGIKADGTRFLFKAA